jgi:hypothetical protein
MLGAVTFFAVSSGLVLPFKVSWYRSMFRLVAHVPWFCLIGILASRSSQLRSVSRVSVVCALHEGECESAENQTIALRRYSYTLQAERRLYTLRDQLKVQFRATQKAQVNERKAADSKRRLTSCVLATQALRCRNLITRIQLCVSRSSRTVEHRP